jgi:hypothetical protein
MGGRRESELSDGALFINGESREALSGPFDVIDPSDESVVGSATADSVLANGVLDQEGR